jgi:hypothetical protein
MMRGGSKTGAVQPLPPPVGGFLNTCACRDVAPPPVRPSPFAAGEHFRRQIHARTTCLSDGAGHDRERRPLSV